MDLTSKILCNTCYVNPGSHSFQRIAWQNPDIQLYYSCPANSTKYFESEGVIDHFRVYFKEIGEEPWAYILDCKGYSLRHATQIQTSLKLVEMAKNTSLKKVWILNYAWPIKFILNAVLAILPQDIQQIIEISNKTLEEIQRMQFIY